MESNETRWALGVAGTGWLFHLIQEVILEFVFQMNGNPVKYHPPQRAVNVDAPTTKSNLSTPWKYIRLLKLEAPQKPVIISLIWRKEHSRKEHSRITTKKQREEYTAVHGLNQPRKGIWAGPKTSCAVELKEKENTRKVHHTNKV